MTSWKRPTSDELREIAEQVRRGEAYVPPYQGRYFTSRPLQFTPPQRPSDDWIYEGFLQNLPTDEKIAEVIAFDPRSEQLMRSWRAAFDRSFPGWTDGSVFPNFKNETSRADHAMNLIEKDLERQDTATTPDYLVFEVHLEWIKPDQRDYRLHAIDDAETIKSLINLEAGQAIIALGEHCIGYTGPDTDGTPLLSIIPNEQRKKRIGRESSNPYWTWEFFQKHMMRKSVTVTGDSDLKWTLCDMASQGHKKAFVKNCTSKGGTWTINLEGVRFLSDAATRVRGTIYPYALNMKAMVQEHLPFRCEQRFFVVDGQVVASVCSDRNLSTLDQVRGKRLDHRVATLLRPEIHHGEFDRGVTNHMADRNLSATFARLARAIAADARNHGILDYVVDIGLTERGPAAIEVNELELSGPYALNRDWITKAYRRRSKPMQQDTVAQAA